MVMNEVDLGVEEEAVGVPPILKSIGKIIVLLFIIWLGFVWFSFEEPTERELKAKALELEVEPSPDDDHEPLRFAMDEEPFVPTMMPYDGERDADELKVIGVLDGDVAQAHVLRKTVDRDSLIISTQVGDQPIAITHNYLNGGTRVFARETSGESLNVHHGGFEETLRMILLIGKNRYHQASEKIPLSDYPYIITTLGEWHELHPDTLVNYGELNSDTHFYLRKEYLEDQERANKKAAASPQ